MNDEKAPRIGPAAVEVMGQQIHMFAFVDPKEFPGGLDVVIFKPGTVAPLGGFNIPTGSLVAALPPGQYADHMVAQMKQVVAQQRKLGPNANGPGIIGLR